MRGKQAGFKKRSVANTLARHWLDGTGRTQERAGHMEGMIAFLKKITDDDVRGVLLVERDKVVWANRQAAQVLPDWTGVEALFDANKFPKKGKWEDVAIADSLYEVECYVLDGTYSIVTLVDQVKYNGLYIKLGSYNPFVILESVLNASYDGVYIADSETTVIMVSDSYERVTGINKAELIGKKMTQIVDEGHFNWSVSLQAAQQRRTVSGWVIVSGKDILTTAVPIFRNNDPEDDIIMIIANVRSVPELSKLLEDMRAEYSYANEKERSELEILRAKDTVLKNLIAKDKNTLATIEKGLRVAKFDANVLLTGETGVGKSEIARLIHNNSNRAKERLVEINCGAMPESLIESELFGYEKGAFTGADAKGKQGFFGLANRGTIFLDEVGELSLNMQTKLLQVIQEKVMYRIGNPNPIHVDVRIIAATNKDLPVLMAEGTFRTDLYYRLAVADIPIPPLRERKDDIPPLILACVSRLNKKYGMAKFFTNEVINAFIDYSWPGNVRELFNLVENLMISAHSDYIELSALPASVRGELKYTSDFESMSLKQATVEFEREFIRKAIEKAGSVRKAADSLGVDPSTITRKLQK